MAALQSSTEGQPLPPKISFADMLRGGHEGVHDTIKEATIHKGEPAIILSDLEVAGLSSPLRLALVGKFDTARPSMEFLRKGFKTIGFKGNFQLGLIDPRHVLIRFDLEEDYLRCWLHGIWNFKTYVMKVLKWTSDFSVSEEPPVVPIWVSLEQLPLYLFSKGPLFSIGRIIGNPLKVDAATLNLSRPSVARVCVEVDLSMPLPSRIWIGKSKGGFWQPISYGNLPDYCFDCCTLGHQKQECGRHLNYSKEKSVWKPKLGQSDKPSSSVQNSVEEALPLLLTGNQLIQTPTQSDMPKIVATHVALPTNVSDVINVSDTPNDVATDVAQAPVIPLDPIVVVSHAAQPAVLQNYSDPLLKAHPEPTAQNKVIDAHISGGSKPSENFSEQSTSIDSGAVEPDDVSITLKEVSKYAAVHDDPKVSNISPVLTSYHAQMKMVAELDSGGVPYSASVPSGLDTLIAGTRVANSHIDHAQVEVDEVHRVQDSTSMLEVQKIQLTEAQQIKIHQHELSNETTLHIDLIPNRSPGKELSTLHSARHTKDSFAKIVKQPQQQETQKTIEAAPTTLCKNFTEDELRLLEAVQYSAPRTFMEVSRDTQILVLNDLPISTNQPESHIVQNENEVDDKIIEAEEDYDDNDFIPVQPKRRGRPRKAHR